MAHWYDPVFLISLTRTGHSDHLIRVRISKIWWAKGPSKLAKRERREHEYLDTTIFHPEPINDLAVVLSELAGTVSAELHRDPPARQLGARERDGLANILPRPDRQPTPQPEPSATTPDHLTEDQVVAVEEPELPYESG